MNRDAAPAAVELVAPAKLTLHLRVTGTRDDGFHTIEAEMVTLDLCDTLWLSEGDGLAVEVAVDAAGPVEVTAGPANLVHRALQAAGRRAAVRLVKRIPAGAGLGGGSADAAAVLRWAGCDDVEVAARLGADVPFCLLGGRARVGGIGEEVEPLPYERRRISLLLPPFGMDTAAVYRSWDALRAGRALPAPVPGGNDLEAAALAVEPRLGQWRDAFASATGKVPSLAGSGSTWFVDGSLEENGLGDCGGLTLGDARASLRDAVTRPA